MRYYPFGEVRTSSGGMWTDQLFTGQRALLDLRIYHYNARFYSPALGRFLSADTLVPGAAQSQAYDRYAYVMNSPIMANDPTGHSCVGPLCPETTPTPSPNNYPNTQDPLNISPASTQQPDWINNNQTYTTIPAPTPFSLVVAPPDFDNKLPDGNPPPPHVDGLPDDAWEWDDTPGMEPGYRNVEDPGWVWSPHDKQVTRKGKEGEDPHWHRRIPGTRGRGEIFPPNPEWGRGNNDRMNPGVYNPNTGRYEPQVSQLTSSARTVSIISGSLSVGYLLYRGIRLGLSPACGPAFGLCAFGP